MNRAFRRHLLPTLPATPKWHLAGRSLTLRKVLLGCGLVSSVLYVTVELLASLRWYAGYSYRDQTVSELLAPGTSTRPVMVALNGIPYGLLLVAFAADVWKVAGPKRVGRLTAAMLVGYAVFGFVGGVLTPMSTREALAAGERTLRNSLHPPMTMVMSLFVLLAIGFGASLLGKRFRWYSYGTIIAMIVCGVATFPYVSRMEANESTPWMGVLERVNIYGIMLWVAALAVSLWRTHAASASTTEPAKGEPAAGAALSHGSQLQREERRHAVA